MPEPLTLVTVSWRKKRRNHRLLFGAPCGMARLDWRRSVAAFQPGQVFGYERWRAGKYGTEDWRIAVLEACRPGAETCRYPGVKPGAKALFRVSGVARCKRFLTLLDTIQKEGDPAAITPMDWTLIGSRFEAGSHIEPLLDRVLERCA